MYVCLCNGYRDSEIREVASQGIRCARQAYTALGSGPCCGRCLDFAQDLIDALHGRPPEDAVEYLPAAATGSAP